MCSARPARLNETTYFNKIRRFISLDQTMCRVWAAQVIDNRGEVGANRRRELLAPETQPALPAGLVRTRLHCAARAASVSLLRWILGFRCNGLRLRF